MFSYSLLSLIGSIFGLAGLILLFVQFCVGNRFITRLITVDLIKINKLHQKIGQFATPFILIHPVIQLFMYRSSVLFILPKNAFEVGVTFGKIALIIFIIVWISSITLRSKLRYRPWLYIHYIGYLLLASAFIHANIIGSFIRSKSTIQSFWFFFAFLFGLVLLFRFIKFLGIGNYKYKLVSKEPVGENILIFKFLALGKRIKPEPGQFMYIQVHPAGESHPFSCMEIENEGEYLRFGIKIDGKFTHKLSEVEINNAVSMDGPYGVFTKEGHNLQPKVLIAGGIGITPFIELVKQYGDRSTYLFYSNRTVKDAVLRNKLISILGDRYIDIITQEKVQGTKLIGSKLNADGVKSLIPLEIVKNAKFFICGKKSFYDYYKGILLELNVSKSSIFYEKFEL